MIQTREELRLFLKEDGKRNGFGDNQFRYWIRLLKGSESAQSYRYLRALRHCEYHSGKNSIYHRLAYFYYSYKMTRLGARYLIYIPLNKCGYGLRIMHLSGGGGTSKRQKSGELLWL